MGFFFDDNSRTDDENRDYFPPLWTIDTKSDSELLKWGKRAAQALTEIHQSRQFMMRTMACAYRGYYYRKEPVSGEKRAFRRDEKRPEFSRVVTHHILSLVEQKVAMQVKYKPETEPYPFSQETKDKYAAICAKKFLKSCKDANKVDLLWPKFIRRAVVCGQAFILPEWDPYIGDKDGNKVRQVSYVGPDDASFKVDVPQRKGDIRIKFPQAENVYLFPATDAESCDGLMVVEYVDVWKLRAEYPHLKDEIIATRDLWDFDYNSLEENTLNNHVAVATFYVKPSRVCDAGIMFKMTPEVILTESKDDDYVQDLPIPREGTECFEFGNIPIIRLVDDEFDGDVNGVPSITRIARQGELYDSLTTQFAMNIAMYCQPKYKFRKGSCQVQQLANIPGLFVEFTDDKGPELMVNNALTQDQFLYRDSVLSNMEKTFGVFSVSRGSPPPGTRATSQLYFYDEQEQQLNAPFKRKFDSAVESLDTFLLAHMGEHYTGDEERVVHILGQDNKWMAETLDTSVLKKRYTIRVKAGSNLPDSKSARLNALFELYDKNPNQQTWNQLMEMVDFGQQEKFIDYARVSVLAAESENEILMAGKECKSPERYELHIDHLKCHYKLVQSAEFKNQPDEVQTPVIEHIGAHEMLAMQIGQKNALYKQQLSMMGQFPIIAPEPITDPSLPPVPPMEPMPNPVGRPKGSGAGKGPAAGALAPEEG